MESVLCKVHPELYIPPLTQPTMNAPDLYHYKKLGMLCRLEAGQSRLVYCGLVLLTELVVWIGGGDLMIWWSDLVVGLVVVSSGFRSGCLVLVAFMV